jgi:ADP-ribose pyrophosphatase
MVVAANPWWTYKRDDCELPGGSPGEYHYVHTNGSAMVVPVTANGALLLVNQYRYLAERESLEFPCGSVKDGSTHELTAHEELAEETGYTAGRLLLAGRFNPYNGVTDEMCHVFIARDLHHVGARPDVTEEFELATLTPGEVDARIAAGEIWDGMSIAAWAIVRSIVR